MNEIREYMIIYIYITSATACVEYVCNPLGSRMNS